MVALASGPGRAGRYRAPLSEMEAAWGGGGAEGWKGLLRGEEAGLSSSAPAFRFRFPRVFCGGRRREAAGEGAGLGRHCPGPWTPAHAAGLLGD